jgi:hypothetical protein
MCAHCSAVGGVLGWEGEVSIALGQGIPLCQQYTAQMKQKHCANSVSTWLGVHRKPTNTAQMKQNTAQIRKQKTDRFEGGFKK